MSEGYVNTGIEPNSAVDIPDPMQFDPQTVELVFKRLVRDGGLPYMPKDLDALCALVKKAVGTPERLEKDVFETLLASGPQRRAVKDSTERVSAFVRAPEDAANHYREIRFVADVCSITDAINAYVENPLYKKGSYQYIFAPNRFGNTHRLHQAVNAAIGATWAAARLLWKPREPDEAPIEEKTAEQAPSSFQGGAAQQAANKEQPTSEEETKQGTRRVPAEDADVTLLGDLIEELCQPERYLAETVVLGMRAWLTGGTVDPLRVASVALTSLISLEDEPVPTFAPKESHA